MRTIGIITLNGFFNYGNRLQNYALQTALEKLNFKVETIWWSKTKNLTMEKGIITLKNIRRHILNRHGFREFGARDFVANSVKEYNMKKFNDKYIHTVFDYNIANDLNDRYDYFVVGSDQVWNPHFAAYNHENMHLTFAEPQKRIAYAASYGVAEIPNKYRNLIKDALKGMKAISTREQAGADIVKRLTGMDVPVLIDPVGLLTQQEWNAIAEQPSYIKDEKYVLTYFLGNVQQEIQNEINEVAQEKNLTIINLMDKSKFDYYSSSPQEFIWLIKNCEIMYTDSFHGTIFSIIMNRPFVVVSRQVKHKGHNMDSRIDTILNTFNLSHRKVSPQNTLSREDLFNISYGETEAVLKREQERSMEFLKKALDIR